MAMWDRVTLGEGVWCKGTRLDATSLSNTPERTATHHKARVRTRTRATARAHDLVSHSLTRSLTHSLIQTVAHHTQQREVCTVTREYTHTCSQRTFKLVHRDV